MQKDNVLPPTLSLGLIIRRFYPNKQQICLITHAQGKATYIIKKRQECQRLWPGMFISFYQSEAEALLTIQGHCKVIGQFASHTPEELLWTHQLFELCYYFIPSRNPNSEVFSFLMQCLLAQQYYNSLGPYYKKLQTALLVHLFYLFGFYSNRDFFVLQEINNYLPDNILSPIAQSLSDELQAFLTRFKEDSYHSAYAWISECIQQHPCSHLFKTIQ